MPVVPCRLQRAVPQHQKLESYSGRTRKQERESKQKAKTNANRYKGLDWVLTLRTCVTQESHAKPCECESPLGLLHHLQENWASDCRSIHTITTCLLSSCHPVRGFTCKYFAATRHRLILGYDHGQMSLSKSDFICSGL